MVPTPTLSPSRLASILEDHADFGAVPLVPSLSVWTSRDEIGLWTALEEAVRHALGPPFFALPWPGAQLIALAVELGLVDMKGKRVLDIGAGSGLASVACAMRGAQVTACDLDPVACGVAGLLARKHGVAMDVLCVDALAHLDALPPCDVVVAGDLVYSRDQAVRFARAIEMWRSQGVQVVLADGGCPFFDPCGLEEVLNAVVRVPSSIDESCQRRARLFVG